MPAVSKKQQKFMGIVRAIQTGDADSKNFTPRVQAVAKDMKKKDVKKFASTKHKGLPMKKEMFSKINKMIKQELKEYTYGVGDVVKDVNPSCPHYGAQGKVKSVSPRSVVFIVKNKGDNFKPGQELEKTHDQMKKMKESVNEKYIKLHPKEKIIVNYRNKKKGFKSDKKVFNDYGKALQWGRKNVANFKKDMISFEIPESVNEMSAKSKKIISKLGKKEKEMFSTMVDMLGFDQVMADYKRDKKAFKQALKDMSENINEKKKMFPPLKMTPKQAKEYKKFIGYAKMGVEYQIDMSLFESVNEDGHTDVASAKRKAMLVVDDANKLLNKLNGMNKEDSLPSWLSDKITLSQNYLQKATDYITNPVESVNEARLDPKQLLQQLGGNKFVAMTGAKNLAVDKSKNELHMKIGRNSKSISHVIIRLTSGDLYDMEFLSIRGSSRKIKSKEKGVYADQLGKMFKKNTGMNVRL